MFKYAICNELYQDWTLDKAFAHAKECGYDGIEIAPFTLGSHIGEISDAERRRIRELAKEHDLEIVGLHWLLAKTEGFHLTHPDATIRQQTADYLIELSQLCRDIGGSLMVFGSPAQRSLVDGVTQEEANSYALEVLKAIAPRLESDGVVLALEPLGPEEGNFLNTAQSAIELAEAVDSPAVKLHLDVKAMSTESKSIPTIIEESRDWLVHFHTNDPNRQGPGMGDVEFEPILKALKSVEYKGWLSVEVFDYSPGIEALSRQSLDYLVDVTGRLEAN